MKSPMLTTILSALALGCHPTEAQAPYEADPQISAPAQVQSDAFALDMFRELIKEQRGNVIFSPACLEGTLQLLRQGARGESAAELAALPLGKEGVPTAMQPTQANAIFIGEAFRLKPGIRTDAVVQAPLMTNPEKAAAQINNWAAENTRDMIPSIITPETLKEGAPTRMVAANAVALEEKWLRPFMPEATKTAHPFTCADGRKSSVPMMYRTANFRYAAGNDWRAVALFYRTDGRRGEPGCFLAILPKGDARAFAAGLTARKFSSIRRALAVTKPREITIGLPRFEQCTPAFPLDSALQACGLRHIFSDAADLSGFADEKLRLGKVLQRCYVKADEQGVRAAAATIAVVQKQSLDLTAPPLILDRPFVWCITDLTTPAAPYFLGLFEHP